jgi:hypothetical protein
MSNFEQKLKEVAEKSFLHLISQGSWLNVEYKDRAKMPKEFMDEVWALVDHEKIKAQMAARLEVELADRIVNHLAAEIATDIKQLLGVPERREALRAVARENLERICNS